MSSDIELVVSVSRDLEERLSTIFACSEKGLARLAEIATSRGLSESTAYIISRIGRIRNSIVHRKSETIFNRSDFIRMNQIVGKALDGIADRQSEEHRAKVAAEAAKSTETELKESANQAKQNKKSEDEESNRKMGSPVVLPELSQEEIELKNRKAFEEKFTLEAFRNERGWVVPNGRVGIAAMNELFAKWRDEQWTVQQRKRESA